MNLERKNIWSKRYPKPDYEALLKDVPPGGPDTPGWEEFEKRLMQRDQDKVNQAQIMLDQIMELSYVHEIDADVDEGPGFVVATLYVDDVFFSSMLKNEFADILRTCSVFAVGQDQGKTRTIIELICFTSR